MKLLSFILSLLGSFFRSQPKQVARVVVDGSNVMHWGGDPDEGVLRAVLDTLADPVIFFDANVGYKLQGKHMDAVDLAAMLGLSATQIVIVPSGTQADGALLDFAAAHGLPVISNDRFRDWTVQHRWVRKKGRVMRGTYKQGSVIWR